MKVDILERTDTRLRMVVEDTTTATMNTLRRTLMMEVPKLAIDDVTIYDNRSALFDEVVAHRLGLLPIPTDPMAFNFQSECTCEGEGCANCTLLYTLTFEGPGTVYSRDLQPASGEEVHEVPDPDVPIVKLGQDQRIMLEATAVLGTGAAHAKWQPVIAAAYREYPTVEIPDDLEIPAKVLDELESMAPEGAVSFEDGTVQVLDPIEGHDFLYNASGRYGLEGVRFGTEPGTFIFRFETDGALTTKQAFRQAIKVLMGKLKGVEDALDDL